MNIRYNGVYIAEIFRLYVECEENGEVASYDCESMKNAHVEMRIAYLLVAFTATLANWDNGVIQYVSSVLRLVCR